MIDLFGLDMAVFRALNLDYRVGLLDPVWFGLSFAGLGQVQGAAVLASVLLVPRLRPLTWPLIATILIAGFPLVHLFKATLKRERPSNLEWAILQEDHRLSSFPSGHTTTSFAIAMFLHLALANTEFARWRPLIWIYAILVGISRMVVGVHWLTDVLAGVCLGTLGGMAGWFLFRQPRPSSPVTAGSLRAVEPA
jgi:undecaprenyl-diphosphatase